MLRKCCGWSRIRTGAALLEVHAVDQAIRNGVNVPYLAIRKNVSFKALDELMNPDISFASATVDYFNRLHMRIEFVPLTSPVARISSFPTTWPPSEALADC